MKQLSIGNSKETKINLGLENEIILKQVLIFFGIIKIVKTEFTSKQAENKCLNLIKNKQKLI